jgi:hypothetical protein
MGIFYWRRRLVAVIPVIALGILPTALLAQQSGAQQSGTDPVANAARRTREQKKEQPKPKKVYTNDDIPEASSSSQPAATNSDKTDETKLEKDKGDTSATKAPPSLKEQEAQWRKRFKDAHDNLAQTEKELDILQRESEKAQVQFYSDPQKALSEQYSRKDIAEKDAKIEAKKQEVAQLKQKISDMEEDLRRSGGDPGWASCEGSGC